MMAGIAIAYLAGVLAAFNPCGFALLPGYLALFLADESATDRPSRIRRALVVGMAVTAGFIGVFAIAGLAVSILSLTFGSWLSWLTMAMGVVLVVAGAATLAGRSISVPLPKVRGIAVNRSLTGMVGYGVVYATVSLSCTLPVFLASVGVAFTDTAGLLSGGVALLAYSLGMGSVLTVAALLVAVAGDSGGRRLRRLTPVMLRISGVFLILAGAYVAWYGWVEWQSFSGEFITGGPTAWAAELSGTVSNWVASFGAGALAVVLIGVSATAVWFGYRRTRPAPIVDAPPATDDAPPLERQPIDRTSLDKETQP